jgi:UDP-glucose 4-epimerase
MMFCVVTGGAGFIGSHLVDALVKRGDDVLVIDNCSAGTEENLASHLDIGAIRFVKVDLLGNEWQDLIAGADCIYHIAADPDVRGSAREPDSVFQNNVVATQRVLEAMRVHQIQNLIFTSTSTVYGEATAIPTPENYAPMEPISVYAASKLAGEALISAYCAIFGIKAWVFRFANIIGERSNHGVIWDFIHKLKDNPHDLEILGDGKQTKSYLDVHSCVQAMLFTTGHANAPFNVFNIGSEDWVDVRRIADIIVEEMQLSDVRYHFTGGERGWAGDVPKMLLSVERLKSLGWKPDVRSEESVREAVRALLQSV